MQRSWSLMKGSEEAVELQVTCPSLREGRGIDSSLKPYKVSLCLVVPKQKVRHRQHGDRTLVNHEAELQPKQFFWVYRDFFVDGLSVSKQRINKEGSVLSLTELLHSRLSFFNQRLILCFLIVREEHFDQGVGFCRKISHGFHSGVAVVGGIHDRLALFTHLFKDGRNLSGLIVV